MCGILGVVAPVPELQFRLALDTLSPRGPDDYGVWQDETITLGHRRLAILDLSPNGHQPMVDSSGRYVIVFNGEIYNFLEIRKDLELLGERFFSGSDTEVLLAGFRRWGEAVFDRCNGMWAVGIWDCVEHRLFLSRDRFGKKPLFYARTSLGFAFASEMKALYPFLQELKPSRDYAWASTHLIEYESTDKTLIDGISRFPAGHHGWLEDGNLRLRRYWCTLDHLRDVPARYEEQVEQFRDIFLDACRIRMRADVPLGTALSGGLDSSATICAMAHIDRTSGTGYGSGADWQHAFVSTFPGSSIDESVYARRVVDHLGIKGTFLEIDPTQDMDRLDQILYQFEELFPTNPLPMLRTYRAVREHGTIVTLDGHGADEMLGGYRGSLFEASADANITEARQVIKTYRASFPEDAAQFRNLNSSYPVLAARWLYRATRTRLGRGRHSRDAAHPAYRNLSGLSKHLYALFHETILPTLLRNYDRYSMSSGVEIRMPFMDHRLVSYCFSLPWQSVLGGGYTKRILRDAMAPMMPQDIAYRRSKIGWAAPMAEWIKGPLKSFFADHLESADFGSCPVVDQQAVRSRFANVWKQDVPTFQEGEHAWASVMPYFWWRSLRYAVSLPSNSGLSTTIRS